MRRQGDVGQDGAVDAARCAADGVKRAQHGCDAHNGAFQRAFQRVVAELAGDVFVMRANHVQGFNFGVVNGQFGAHDAGNGDNSQQHDNARQHKDENARGIDQCADVFQRIVMRIDGGGGRDFADVLGQRGDIRLRLDFHVDKDRQGQIGGHGAAEPRLDKLAHFCVFECAGGYDIRVLACERDQRRDFIVEGFARGAAVLVAVFVGGGGAQLHRDAAGKAGDPFCRHAGKADVDGEGQRHEKHHQPRNPGNQMRARAGFKGDVIAIFLEYFCAHVMRPSGFAAA
ncbi:MAG TPA: hypothetical protein DIW20_06195 [Rhodospirillaceae bacterium]|nr:hypothetical protein [Rhodospirillaceae bacterium]